MNKYLSILIVLLAFALRLWHFNAPPSPYWEEVALGYDAYSISETGRDHHGHAWPLVAFESFGDWKPSLYFYLTAAVVKVVGLSVWAVRLPSLLAGVMIVWAVGVLARHSYYLLRRSGESADDVTAQHWSWLAMGVTSISPWAITMSRAAWESNLATALILWGISFFFGFMRGQKRLFLWLAVLLLGLATYAYHAARLSAPLVGLLLVIYYLWTHKSKTDWKALLVAAILGLLLFAPILLSMRSEVGQQRIAETSLFSDIAVIERSNELRDKYKEQWWGYIISHRYVLFTGEILSNLFDHFRPSYLFVTGDINPRHSIQSLGQLYYVDLLLLGTGLFYVWRRKKLFLLWLLALWMVLLLPSALTNLTPHALRSLAAMPFYLLFISIGVWQLTAWNSGQRQKIVLFILLVIYLVQFGYFYHQLQVVYPSKYRHEWQYGYQEMLEKLAHIEDQYDHIYITREQGRPAMYYFFYRQIDPRLVQEASSIVAKDRGELLEFDNVSFIDRADQINPEHKSLIISSAVFYNSNFQAAGSKIIERTTDDVWLLYTND